MKKLVIFTLILLVSVAGWIGVQNLSFSSVHMPSEQGVDKLEPDSEDETIEAETDEPETKEKEEPASQEGWMGKTSRELMDTMGEPDRKDKSAYGYTWWVYEQPTTYLQFGIAEGKVVTWVGTGDINHMSDYSIGQPYDEVSDVAPFSETLTLETEGTYTFELTEVDLAQRPLVKLDDETYAQLYFDTVTRKLSSIRVMSPEVLLILQPYRVTYRGELHEPPFMSEEEWKTVQAGNEQQIMTITNKIRERHSKSKLEWSKLAANVAYAHSKDMKSENYFSHHSQNGDGLKERLEKGDVHYVRAGENIAAQYIDAAAAVNGWLNSEGHREALLDGAYTHLGVGVHRDYYTQNFLTIP
ncbi:CAP domain-containing protein [Thalassobacillus sp. CUG 92003]|uniref:CAP domain-containing protein n=1 Tax=Thalassobacillus sp. CUG 92003 TaxID=2736641 RepID=UPI0015E67C7A|nr:CAP domain-containing protein [Thalassobacillus sp. CUG 92003]